MRAAMEGVGRKVLAALLWPADALLGWIGAPEPTTPPLRNDSTFSERLKMELATPPAMPTAPGVRLPDLSDETDGEALPSALRLSWSASEVVATVGALGVECSDREIGRAHV